MKKKVNRLESIDRYIAHEEKFLKNMMRIKPSDPIKAIWQPAFISQSLNFIIALRLLKMKEMNKRK